MAEWTTAYINDLPDSAFLYIEPGGKKDEDGKTVPRTLRHFPYKDASGAIDLPHLRNAIARIPQSSLPQSVKDRVQAKARRILARETGGSAAASEVFFNREEVRAFSPLPVEFAEADDGTPYCWHRLVPVGSWRHPRYGVVEITPDDVAEFAQHWQEQVLGQEVPVDELEGHRLSDEGAYGWLREVDVRDDGLWGKIEWTPPGVQAVQEQRYKYISPQLYLRDLPYRTNEGGRVPNVVKALSLTNRPVFKGQPALTVSMSEYETVADVTDEMTGGDNVSEATDVMTEEHEIEVPEETAAEDETLAASEEQADEEVDDAGQEDEQDAPSEPPDEGAEENEVDEGEDEAIPMSEYLSLRERLEQLEAERVQEQARAEFEGLRFSEVVAHKRGHALRLDKVLSPHAVDTATRLYLALPEELQPEFLAFCEGGLETIPLGELGPVAMSESGGIEKAIREMDVTDQVKDDALAFAEEQGWTEAKRAQDAIDHAVKMTTPYGR